jgi:hypothetical protein
MAKGLKKKNMKRKLAKSDTDKTVSQDLKQQAAATRDSTKLTKKKPISSLFSINTTANAGTKKRLESDRFKRKIRGETTSLVEEKKINQLAKKLKNQKGASKPAPSPSKKNASNELFDLWGDAPEPVTKKPVIPTNNKHFNIPTLVKPHPGQSINPRPADQQALMEMVVAQVEKKQDVYREKKLKPSSLTKRRPRTKKEKAELRFQAEKKLEKEKRRQEHNMLEIGKKMREDAKERGKAVSMTDREAP